MNTQPSQEAMRAATKYVSSDFRSASVRGLALIIDREFAELRAEIEGLKGELEQALLPRLEEVQIIFVTAHRDELLQKVDALQAELEEARDALNEARRCLFLFNCDGYDYRPEVTEALRVIDSAMSAKEAK